MTRYQPANRRAHVTHVPRGSGFARGEPVIIERVEKTKALGWRYHVSTPKKSKDDISTEGWLFEDDLCDEFEAREQGLI